MNKNFEKLIKRIEKSRKKCLATATNGNSDEKTACINSLCNDSIHNIILWANDASVFTDLKNRIEELFYLYQKDEVTQKEFIKQVAEAMATAEDDRVDGMLLVEKMLKIPGRSATATKQEKKIQKHTEAGRRLDIYREMFPRVFEEEDS